MYVSFNELLDILNNTSFTNFSHIEFIVRNDRSEVSFALTRNTENEIDKIKEIFNIDIVEIHSLSINSCSIKILLIIPQDDKQQNNNQ